MESVVYTKSQQRLREKISKLTDRELKEEQLYHTLQCENHLSGIRLNTGWLVGIIIALLMLGIASALRIF